jgi:hypothetical protein
MACFQEGILGCKMNYGKIFIPATFTPLDTLGAPLS